MIEENLKTTFLSRKTILNGMRSNNGSVSYLIAFYPKLFKNESKSINSQAAKLTYIIYGLYIYQEIRNHMKNKEKFLILTFSICLQLQEN